MVLNVTIENRIATLQDFEGEFVCGNSEDTVMFNFDDEWANYPNRTARFKWNGEYKDVDFTGDTVNIPPIKNAKVIRFGVYSGESAEGENEISTTEVKIPCLLCTRCGGERANGSIGENYTNEAKGYAAEAKASALSAKASEEATADMGAEVQAHQAYYDAMVACVDAGIFAERELSYGGDTILDAHIVAEGTTEFTNASNYWQTFKTKVLVLPNGLKSIGDNACQFDPPIKSIKLPPSLETIGNQAFYRQEKLSKVKIPSKVKSIGDWAFAKWEDNLTLEVDMTAFSNGAAFPTLGSNAFGDEGMDAGDSIIENLSIKVPRGRKAELSKMTNWSTYADYMVEV